MWVRASQVLPHPSVTFLTMSLSGYLLAVKTAFSSKQYPRELRIRTMQALVEARLLSNSGGWADVTLSQLAKLDSVRSRVLKKILESFKGEETSISDEKIRKEPKVPPVHVLVMERRLQLAARTSRGAPPALFALLQRDRSPWKRQVLVDLCRLRDTKRDKLGTMPPPTAEPEAWERLWKDHPCAWKRLLRVRRGSFSAHLAVCVSVRSNPDMEF